VDTYPTHSPTEDPSSSHVGPKDAGGMRRKATTEEEDDGGRRRRERERGGEDARFHPADDDERELQAWRPRLQKPDSTCGTPRASLGTTYPTTIGSSKYTLGAISRRRGRSQLDGYRKGGRGHGGEAARADLVAHRERHADLVAHRERHADLVAHRERHDGAEPRAADAPSPEAHREHHRRSRHQQQEFHDGRGGGRGGLLRGRTRDGDVLPMAEEGRQGGGGREAPSRPPPGRGRGGARRRDDGGARGRTLRRCWATATTTTTTTTTSNLNNM
jgi:hypothetical protein